MMDSTEYAECKRQQRLAVRAAAPTLASFVAQQVERTDSVGVLCRDLLSESARVGKQIAAMRNRRDLLWHSQHCPKELRLTRADAVQLWEEFIVAEREYYAQHKGYNE